VHDNPPPVWTSAEILEQSNSMAGRGRNKSGHPYPEISWIPESPGPVI